ncbi:MAG: Glycosyl hydrolase family 57, partial [Parcubacteria group bacterium GW2011_GWB1_53_43]
MASVCFYFQVHQPWRVKRFRIFDIGHGGRYFDDHSKTNLNNEKIFRKVAEKSYLPANEVMLSLLTTHPEFRISYSLSGVLMEQMESFGPDVLDSFQRLVDTGRAELLSETYYHSLSFLYSREEFAEQVKLHRDKVRSLFGVTPKVFRNTELIFNNDLAQAVAELGYSAVLAEGADHVLGWRSPNFLYTPKGAGGIKLLLKNYKLSDDIAFRFGERSWKEFPLTAPKFAQWVNAINGNGNVVNLFMDYETFGEHQWEDTGIFKFMESLPREILKHPDNDFVTVSEAAERYAPVAELDIPHYVSWADTERDLSAWLSNEIQHDAISKLYALEGEVKGSGNRRLVEDWRRLT